MHVSMARIGKIDAKYHSQLETIVAIRVFRRQKADIDSKDENVLILDDIDFSKIGGLSAESQDLPALSARNAWSGKSNPGFDASRMAVHEISEQPPQQIYLQKIPQQALRKLTS